MSEVIKSNAKKQGVKIYFKDNLIIIFSYIWFLILSEFQIDALTRVLDLFGHAIRNKFNLEGARGTLF